MAKIVIAADDRLLDRYYETLETLQKKQDVSHEGAVRRAFGELLDGIGTKRKWTLVEELGKKSSKSARTVYPDGTLRDTWKLPHAYWEAKDTDDDLDAEIEKKKARGYPLDNIIFEDTQTAVLYQDGYEAFRSPVRERERFATLLTRFVNHEIEPFEDFEAAIDSYGEEIKNIASSLKEKIEAAHEDKRNKQFQNQFADFMEVCRTSLNPNISQAAVDEMLIQHLMTERIIRRVFNVERFTRTNVIASEIEKVIDALTSQYFDRTEFLGALNRFYVAIENAADRLADFQQKQHFINTVYERFFQGYSVKVADTHGIVYTPQEIVDFMCAAVEEVLQNEFGKKLGDDGVYLIDPATGTGNFVINILRRAFERNPRNFEQFYRERLFANEVMLMPYYIASLNIEHEYYELTGKTEPFEGICFVDTLDLAKGRQMSFSFMTEKNTERVERQKEAEINVIIGNPPYNALQQNAMDKNPNRTYEKIDERVQETYSKDSKATNKNQLADPYVKFFRWASDRLEDRDGIVCYVSNNSFLESTAFDGMRKHLMQDFDHIYIVDLKGDVRRDSMRDGIPIGEEHTVFGLSAMVGISISILIRNEKHTKKEIFYNAVDWKSTRIEKFRFLQNVKTLSEIDWNKLRPNQKHTWLIPEHSQEFEDYISIGTKDAKSSDKLNVETIFKNYGRGVATSRDAFVYDYSESILRKRIKDIIDNYNSELDRYNRSSNIIDVNEFVDYEKVKWSESLIATLSRNHYLEFRQGNIRNSLYRPFTHKLIYFDANLNERRYQFPYFLPTIKEENENEIICCTNHSQVPFSVQITKCLPDVGIGSRPGQCFPFYVYDDDGSNRRENITDWALEQFRGQYGDASIGKWDIFYYVYGLLHHPDYRERYADNLKRELPRIPFVPSDVNVDAGTRHALSVRDTNDDGDDEASGFWIFSRAGKQLADLHLNYETVDRYELEWDVTKTPISYVVEKMRPRQKRDATDGNYKVYDTLVYNDTLTLKGIPEKAFGYRLGNRSALDWIVDQYRVKTDKRSGITSDPNGYSDDEQYIVQLVERVITVSLKTVAIVEGLAQLAFRDEG